MFDLSDDRFDDRFAGGVDGRGRLGRQLPGHVIAIGIVQVLTRRLRDEIR